MTIGYQLERRCRHPIVSEESGDAGVMSGQSMELILIFYFSRGYIIRISKKNEHITRNRRAFPIFTQ
jgi:hypothetical protein